MCVCVCIYIYIEREREIDRERERERERERDIDIDIDIDSRIRSFRGFKNTVIQDSGVSRRFRIQGIHLSTNHSEILRETYGVMIVVCCGFFELGPLNSIF